MFLIRKLLLMLLVLFGAAVIMFLLMHAIPGSPWSNYSPAQRMLSQISMSEAAKRELNHRFGLDLPLWRQFARYFIGDFNEDGSFECGAVCGNLGPSMQQSGRSVQGFIFGISEGKNFWESKFGYSVRLVLFAALITLGFGIPLGILGALKPQTWLSRSISIGLAGLISIPNFVLGLLAVLLLASWLKVIKVLPDWQVPGNWIVPAMVLAAMPMASVARVTNTAVTNVLHEDYIRTAHAKGLTRNRVLRVHVMRIAFVPIITFIGPTLMEMFTGLFIVESLYGFPGIGRAYWDAVLHLDYPMVLGLTLVYAAGFMLFNLVSEIVTVVLDPRIRSEKVQEAP